jgi:hypothetical protein
MTGEMDVDYHNEVVKEWEENYDLMAGQADLFDFIPVVTGQVKKPKGK